MKNLILIFVMMIPLTGFSQWTQQQQDEYRKQMDEFRQQMDQQMQTLRDSLAQLQKEMNNADWSTFDTSNWKYLRCGNAQGDLTSMDIRDISRRRSVRTMMTPRKCAGASGMCRA
jgi:hypothetical protein